MACIFKAVASHVHHSVYDYFHPNKVEKPKTAEVAIVVGKVDYGPQPKDKQLPCL